MVTSAVLDVFLIVFQLFRSLDGGVRHEDLARADVDLGQDFSRRSSANLATEPRPCFVDVADFACYTQFLVVDLLLRTFTETPVSPPLTSNKLIPFNKNTF